MGDRGDPGDVGQVDLEVDDRELPFPEWLLTQQVPRVPEARPGTSSCSWSRKVWSAASGSARAKRSPSRQIAACADGLPRLLSPLLRTRRVTEPVSRLSGEQGTVSMEEAEMNCPQCLQPLQHEVAFCGSCGAKIQRTSPGPADLPTSGVSAPLASRRSRSKVAVLLLGVAVAASVGGWLWLGWPKAPDPDSVADLTADSISQRWEKVLTPAPGASGRFADRHGNLQLLEGEGLTLVGTEGTGGDYSATVTALDSETGEVRWVSAPASAPRACKFANGLVLCFESRAAATFDDGRVIALDAKDGSVRFHTPWEELFSNFEGIDGGFVTAHVGAGAQDAPHDLTLTRYSLTGDLQWQKSHTVTSLQGLGASLAAVDERVGALFTRAEDGRQLIVDAKTGELTSDRSQGFLATPPFPGAWSTTGVSSTSTAGMPELVAPGASGPVNLGAGFPNALTPSAGQRRVLVVRDSGTSMFAATPGSSKELWSDTGYFVGTCQGSDFVQRDGGLVRREAEGRAAWSAKWDAHGGGETRSVSLQCAKDLVLIAGETYSNSSGSGLFAKLLRLDDGREVWAAPTAEGVDPAYVKSSMSHSGYTEAYATQGTEVRLRRFSW